MPIAVGTLRIDYANSLLAQKAKLADAYINLKEAFRTASDPPTLAQYRAALGSTLTIILTLPASYTTELGREQDGLGLPDAPVSGWTLANCQGWHSLLNSWLAGALAAAALSEALYT